MTKIREKLNSTLGTILSIIAVVSGISTVIYTIADAKSDNALTAQKVERQAKDIEALQKAKEDQDKKIDTAIEISKDTNNLVQYGVLWRLQLDADTIRQRAAVAEAVASSSSTHP